jgi:hypothetical protein
VSEKKFDGGRKLKLKGGVQSGDRGWEERPRPTTRL